MQVVTLLNQKGGVGKTSCTHHLAGALSRLGRRVLLLDNDPQSSLSQGFYGPDEVRDLDPAETIAAVYAGDRPYPSQLIRPSGFEGIDLVPGSRAATSHNVPDPDQLDRDRQCCLRDFLDAVRSDCAYDLVLIDCPPNLHLCSFAALVASDYLIVPLQPEDYGAQGIADVRESLALVQAGPNPRIRLLGYLLTMVAKGKIHEAVEGAIRDLYGAEVFAAVFPAGVAYKEAITFRQPIGFYKPKGAPARRVQEIAEELLARIAGQSFQLAEVA